MKRERNRQREENRNYLLDFVFLKKLVKELKTDRFLDFKVVGRK